MEKALGSDYYFIFIKKRLLQTLFLAKVLSICYKFLSSLMKFKSTPAIVPKVYYIILGIRVNSLKVFTIKFCNCVRNKLVQT